MNTQKRWAKEDDRYLADLIISWIYDRKWGPGTSRAPLATIIDRAYVRLRRSRPSIEQRIDDLHVTHTRIPDDNGVRVMHFDCGLGPRWETVEGYNAQALLKMSPVIDRIPQERQLENGFWAFETTDGQQYLRHPHTNVIRCATFTGEQV